MVANPDWNALGEVQAVLGKLYNAVDALKKSIASDSYKVTDKLDTWIATNKVIIESNQRLLEVIVANSQEVGRSTRSYEQGLQLFTQLQQQLQNLQSATIALRENFEFSPPTAAAAASQPESNPANLTQLTELHEGLNQALTTFQSLQTLFAQSVEAQIQKLDDWSHQNQNILPQKPAPPETWKDKLSSLTIAIGTVGAIACVGFGVAIALQLPQMSEAQTEQAAWANSREGQYARDLMRWNNHKLSNQQCMEDVKRLNVTLSVDGRPATSGFCTVWVVPPEKREFAQEQ